jgi:hypothetical protein
MKNKKLFLLLIILIVPFLCFASGAAEPAPENLFTGVVEYLEGVVTVNGSTADFGTPVHSGSIVETGEGSYCEVVFADKNIFRVQESTIAEIKLAAGDSEIKVEKGGVAALFSKLDALTGDDYFEVRTGITTAGVRGTAFFIKVIDPDTTYICICNGELDVSEPSGRNSAKISSGHHKAFYYRGADGKIEVSSAPMIFHTDEDMELLADRINEKINWYY